MRLATHKSNVDPIRFHIGAANAIREEPAIEGGGGIQLWGFCWSLGGVSVC